jgi:radical SAM protein with 4Fe4S-binding SPASM domain
MNYSESEVWQRVVELRREFADGRMVLRQEGKQALLYGNVREKYRLFQLLLNPLAALLFRAVRDGMGPAELKRLLASTGMPEARADYHLQRLVAIANFNRDDVAVRHDVIADSKLKAPLTVSWDITNTCNLTCDYCINESAPVVDDGMPLDQCLALVDEMADMGIYVVWIGGGEPLVKRGIDRILLRLKERNIKVILHTNGTLLRKPSLLELVGETCDEVNVTIDGATQASHARLRGESARLDATVNGVRALKERFGDRVYVSALSVLHRKNIEELGEIIDFVYGIGCNKWTHDELYRLGRAATMNDLVLSHEGYDRLHEIVTAKARQYEGRMLVEAYVRMHQRPEPGKVKPFYGCIAGNQEVAIQHNGDVFPCQKLQYPKYFCGNVMQTPLAEIWREHPILNWLRNRDITQTECSGCGIFAQGQCNGGCLAEKEIVFQRHDTRDPMCPENRGVYEDVLVHGRPYPFAAQPSRERVPSADQDRTWRPQGLVQLRVRGSV